MNTTKNKTNQITTKTKSTNNLTYLEKVVNKLSELKVGGSFKKEEFITKTWGEYNEFVVRSYDVYYCKAKRLIPHKTFKLTKGVITRTK